MIKRALPSASVIRVRAVIEVEDHVGRVALIGNRIDAGETVDLYADLAADLPLLALARLVELPDTEAEVVKEFSRSALELFWAPLDEPRQRELAHIVGRYYGVLREFCGTAGGYVGGLGELVAQHDLQRDTPIGALSSFSWPDRRRRPNS